MKKKICLVLAMVLMLVLSGVNALADDIILESTAGLLNGFNYIYSIGDTLYANSGKGVFTWNPGDEKMSFFPYEEEEDTVASNTFTFAVDDAMYAVRVYLEREDDYTELTGAKLFDAAIDGGKVTFEERSDLDWEDMTSELDDGVTVYSPRNIIGLNGVAYMLFYDWSGGDFLPHVGALDIEEESVELVDDLDDSYQIASYRDGKLLAFQVDTEEREAEILAYDPEEEETESLGTLSDVDVMSIAGLAYSAAEDKVYITQKNEVHEIDLEAGALGAKVSDAPLQALSFYMPAVVLQDGSYAIMSDRIAVLDVSGVSSGTTTRINISDTNYCMAIESAIEKLPAIDSSLRVFVNRDGSTVDNIVENLMNQDNSVDIYVLDTTKPVYDALLRRGYMMSLDDCESVKALAERMYPAERESLNAGGHIVALPLEVKASVIGFSQSALEKMGMKIEDIPDNWNDLLDFLPTLKDQMEENDIRLTFSFFPVDQVRRYLFNQLFNDYLNYMNLTDVEMGFNTEILRGLLDKLEALDLLALGCAEDDDDINEIDYDVFFGGNSSGLLINPNMDCTFNSLSGDAFTPVLLGMNADAAGNLVIKNVVAFVNPYCEHPDAAKKFMDVLAENMTNATLYSVIPDLNTPLRGETNEKLVADMQEEMDTLRKQIEKADGAKRKLLQDDLESKEETYDLLEKAMWDIHQGAIDWYRPHAGNMTVATTNWLDEEAQSMIDQYLKGDVSAGEMLEAIDRKVKMMRMEGN